MKEPTEKILDEIANDLRGTCTPLDDVLEQHNIEFITIPIDLMMRLDDTVLQCETCSWWCDTDEMRGVECRDCRDG